MLVTMVDEIHTLVTHCVLECLDIKYGSHDQESDALVNTIRRARLRQEHNQSLHCKTHYENRTIGPEYL